MQRRNLSNFRRRHSNIPDRKADVSYASGSATNKFSEAILEFLKISCASISNQFRLLTYFALVLAGLMSAGVANAREYVVGDRVFSDKYAVGLEAVQAEMARQCAASNPNQFRDCKDPIFLFELYQTDEVTNKDKWVWQGAFYATVNSLRLTITAQGTITYKCPTGWNEPNSERDVGFCWREENETICDSCDGRVAPVVGNPIILSGGVKQQTETDYLSGSGTLQFTRTYRSDLRGWAHNYQAFALDFTQSNPGTMPDNACVKSTAQATGAVLCTRLAGRRLPNDFGVRRGNGRLKYFGSSTDLLPAKDIDDRVTPITDAAGKRTGWSVTNARAQTLETYDLTGRLQKTKALNGQALTFSYSTTSTPTTVAPKPGLLTQVTDHFGRKLGFIYDAKGRMTKMKDPAGQEYLYGYDGLDNLTTVTYPDGKIRTYVYNEPELTSGTDLPFALTGIIDENNVRFASFGYDATGKAVSTEHAGGVNKHTIAEASQGELTDTDALGAVRTYSFSMEAGALRAGGMYQPAPKWPYGSVASTTVQYDSNGNVKTTNDLDSWETVYEYDLTRNLEIRRREAQYPHSRIISTSWHPIFRLPAKVAEPLRLTTFDYYADGTLWKRTVQETQDATGILGLSATPVGIARTTTFTYNSAGQLATIKGPRTDVADLTTYAYTADGNLSTIKNSVGHVTTYERYDAHGRVGRITTPDGTVTELTYKPRGWLESSKISAGGLSEVTQYEYDPAGQLTHVALPDNTYIKYAYDDAHRLYHVSDTAGNSIEYTLDLMGNKTEEKASNNAGKLARKVSRIFDVLGRVESQTGASQ